MRILLRMIKNNLFIYENTLEFSWLHREEFIFIYLQIILMPFLCVRCDFVAVGRTRNKTLIVLLIYYDRGRLTEWFHTGKHWDFIYKNPPSFISRFPLMTLIFYTTKTRQRYYGFKSLSSISLITTPKFRECKYPWWYNNNNNNYNDFVFFFIYTDDS